MTAGPLGARRRARFHDLVVSDVRALTADAIEVTFTVPERLAGAYDYAPGQYVALHVQLDGTDLRRSYSICAAPSPGTLKVAIKRDLGGHFSTWALEELAAGMRLAVMEPDGRFCPNPAGRRPARFAGVAAGSGITPMMALIAHALAEHPENRFDLVYSNRTAPEAMFVDELADLKDRHRTRLAVHHVLTRERRSSELLSGRLDAERLATVLGTLLHGEGVDEWFLCGPVDLVQRCRATLAEMGIPPDAVRHELFSAGSARPGGPGSAPAPAAPAGVETRTISFRLDGMTSTVSTPVPARESILAAALRVRPDVPFACAGGVCGTCRARLTDGEVTMAENYALEPEELERGYVLTCQAIPQTPSVRVDYDG